MGIGLMTGGAFPCIVDIED